MTSNKYFRIRKPDIIFEFFDNEVVLINLENGNYYSIQGVAAEIWNLVEGSIGVNEIIKYIMSRYQGVQNDVAQAVDLFLAELSQDGLIESFEPKQASENHVGETLLPEHTSNRPAFVPPQLNRYTDMQNLLLLDPIHDVGEQGWPNSRSDIQPQSE